MEDKSLEFIMQLLDKLTDEERLSLFKKYCVFCGTVELPCYCTKDD